MVIVIIGIMAGTLTMFMRPAVEAYVDSRRRSDLTDMADTALRQITQDIRRAVPNSLIAHSATCLQLVPTIAGGRYRKEAASPLEVEGKPLDTTAATDVFDVLTPLAKVPAVGDWVVVNNQNTQDVYTNINREQLSAVTTASTAAENAVFRYRLTLASSKQFPLGYDGGRFVLVANAEQSIFYHCQGDRLYKTTAGFGATASSCNLTTGAVVATDVESCAFSYTPGATQQRGFAWLVLNLMRSDERVSLAHGVHVDNVP